MQVSSIPVECCSHHCANCRQCRSGFDQMQDDVLVAVSRVNHLDTATIPVDSSAVTGLAAAHWIKYGAVENDSVGIHRQHAGLTLFQIRVIPEQDFSHVSCAPQVLHANVPSDSPPCKIKCRQSLLRRYNPATSRYIINQVRHSTDDNIRRFNGRT